MSAAIEIFEINGAHWLGRRTCVDNPGRAYCFRLAGWKESAAMPGIIGFYVESIDDARERLKGRESSK